MYRNRSAHNFNNLPLIAAAAAALTLAGARADAGTLVFEGYRNGSGAPPIGGGVASQTANLPAEPWFGTKAYRWLDGWNRAPRVPQAEYAAYWTAGGHAGTGTSIDGAWASLDESQPGSYAFDFQGYEVTSRVFDTDSASPTYGHETRTYSGAATSWTLWDLRDLGSPAVLGTGTLTNLVMDIFYDPLHAGADPNIIGVASAVAVDDGNAFYDDLIAQFGTPVLDFTFICDDPPIIAINPGRPEAVQWAIYGARYVISAEAPVPAPAPATLALLATGLAGIGMRRRRKHG